MSERFAPADGVQARWRHCLDLALEHEPGDTFSYAEAQQRCGDGTTVRQVQYAMREARIVLEREHQMTIIGGVGAGWRVLRPHEHAGSADERRHRARRQVARGISTLNATRRDELSQEQRQESDRVGATLHRSMELLERHRASMSELQSRSQGPSLPPRAERAPEVQDAIDRAVAEVPPLSAAQKDRVRGLMRPPKKS